MAVYFVYRCGYLRPTNVLVRRFDGDSVVEWFRRHWPRRRAPANRPRYWHDHVTKLLGVQKGEDAIGFVCMFEELAEEKVAPPTLIEEVANALERMYCTGIAFQEHCVQVLADDDEIDAAYYFFDDRFLRKNGDLAAYLLHLLDCGWRLPEAVGERSSTPFVEVAPMEREELGRGSGGFDRLYVSHLITHDGEELIDLDRRSARYLAGARVPDLCRELMRAGGDDAVFPGGLVEALHSADLGETEEERAFLAALREDPDDDLNWNVYADWLAERGEPSPNVRLLRLALPQLPAVKEGPYLMQIDEHVVQLFDEEGSHWFAFDDLWVGTYPALADSLLRFATRWDMLSSGDETAWVE